MGKKKKKKKKKKKNKKKVEKVDYGSVELYCKHCDYIGKSFGKYKNVPTDM
ncbi:hypothetical protein R4Z09_28135 [Niallia oryzisoli]|uniref:Uncharacterized protein n=1 Tax=Niallia oryzisoli TaxID=1737571 RepID=A0ABZ2CDA9_9BACI